MQNGVMKTEALHKDMLLNPQAYKSQSAIVRFTSLSEACRAVRSRNHHPVRGTMVNLMLKFSWGRYLVLLLQGTICKTSLIHRKSTVSALCARTAQYHLYEHYQNKEHTACGHIVDDIMLGATTSCFAKDCCEACNVRATACSFHSDSAHVMSLHDTAYFIALWLPVVLHVKAGSWSCSQNLYR